MSFYAIVLAAGKGKRMRDEAAPEHFPKVLRQACGSPLISYAINALRSGGIEDISIIVGYGADRVKQTLGNEFRYIYQEEQLGSGHAVACAKDSLGSRAGHAVVMCGDSPLFTSETISSLTARHAESQAVITLVSAALDNPTGYGRIKRRQTGEIAGIVEEKCATTEEKLIREINGGAYVFDSQWLWANIDRIERNDAGEWNLTDLARIAISQCRKVEAVEVTAEEVMGVNTPDDLKHVEEMLQSRA